MSVTEAAAANGERAVVNIKIKLIRRERRQPQESNLIRGFGRMERKDRKEAEQFAIRQIVGSWTCSADGMVRGYNPEKLKEKPPVVYILDLTDNIDRLLNLKNVLGGKKTDVWEVPHLHPGNGTLVPEDSPQLRIAYVTSRQKKLVFCFDLIPAT